VDRRRFVLTSLAGVLAGPFAVGAQPAGKVYRIGALGAFDSPGWAGFREGLRELGWEDGRNIVMEFRFAGGRPERYRELAEELVRLNVDVLAAANSQSVRAAKEATGTIPIVMFEVGHPVDAGFVASLARPGGNVTGMSSQLSELEGKSVEFLREVVPGMRRVALMWDPNNAGSAVAAKYAQPLVERLGLHFISIPVRHPEDLERALTTVAGERPDAVIVHPPIIWANRAMIVEFAVKHRLPSVTASRAGVEGGLLMAHAPNLFDQGRRAANYVDRIFKGAKPADLPVEQPTKFELIINLKTAKALGLTIPPSLLARADQIIE
jgi:putative tryptophan/tyrosine transport system substrate-binding protein